MKDHIYVSFTTKDNNQSGFNNPNNIIKQLEDKNFKVKKFGGFTDEYFGDVHSCFLSIFCVSDEYLLESQCINEVVYIVKVLKKPFIVLLLGNCSRSWVITLLSSLSSSLCPLIGDITPNRIFDCVVMIYMQSPSNSCFPYIKEMPWHLLGISRDDLIAFETDEILSTKINLIHSPSPLCSMLMEFNLEVDLGGQHFVCCKGQSGHHGIYLNSRFVGLLYISCLCPLKRHPSWYPVYLLTTLHIRVLFVSHQLVQ